MKNIVLLLLLLFPLAAPADALGRAAFPGTWVAPWTAVPGEQQVLTINQELMAEFHRQHDDGNAQYLFSTPAEIVDDLLVLKFFNKDGQLESKLVLSGWSSADTDHLYGTFYLYSRGEPFNGFPVTFERQ